MPNVNYNVKWDNYRAGSLDEMRDIIHEKVTDKCDDFFPGLVDVNGVLYEPTITVVLRKLSPDEVKEIHDANE